MFRLVNLYSLFVYIEHNGDESPKAACNFSQRLNSSPYILKEFLGSRSGADEESSSMRHGAVSTVPKFPIFWKNVLQYSTLKIKPLKTIETSRTIYPSPQRYISESRNLPKIQGQHKVFPWLQTFVTRKQRGIQTYLWKILLVWIF